VAWQEGLPKVQYRTTNRRLAGVATLTLSPARIALNDSRIALNHTSITLYDALPSPKEAKRFSPYVCPAVTVLCRKGG
jgi:hypothetical protein